RPGTVRQIPVMTGGAANADADDGRRPGLAARVEHAVDDEGLDRVDTVRGHRHAQPGIVLRARALRHHLDGERGVGAEVDVDDRHAAAAVIALVLARDRMHHRRAQRVVARRALAAAAGRFLERKTAHLAAPTDPYVAM